MNLKDSYLHGSDLSALMRDLTITSGNGSLTITYATPDSTDATKYKTKTLQIPVGCITGLGSHATDSTAYIPLAGSTTSAPITGTLYIKDANGLYINSNNADYNIWHVVGNSGSWESAYGFNLLYLGTGGGNENDLVLYSHNQGSTHKEVYRIHLDGNIIFGQNVTASNALSVSGSTSLSSLTVSGASTFQQSINGSILGNAATASRLLNARTIWGLSFDGSGNVSGALSGATTITASGTIKSTFYGPAFLIAVASGNWAYMDFDTSNRNWHIGSVNSTAGRIGITNAFEIRDATDNYNGISIRPGTSSGGKLVITSSSSEASVGYHNSSSTKGYPIWVTGADTTNLCFWTTGGGSSYSEKVRITSDGKVGISTNSPSHKLHIIGETYSSTNIISGEYLMSSNGNVYIGSTSGSRCHEQYDSTNKCLKFIFD